MAETPNIEIKGLYKIFGRDAPQYVDLVRRGLGKTEMMERYDHILGLRDINIKMIGGHVQVIMGLSGSGKSTLIRHINRLVDPTEGRVLVDDIDITGMDSGSLREFRRNKTAMVFQKFALLPHRDVLSNATYGLYIKGIDRRKQIDTAMRWLERVGLKGFEHHYPNQLSGGMQQRVGLARALTNNAPILLMDEAFSALDPLIRRDMQCMLLDLQKEIHKTVVFITHDLDEALRLGDRIAILRDGEIIQQGPGQEIVMHPADDYISKFVQEVNRGRVLLVSTIMSPGTSDVAPEALMIPRTTCLEDALRLLNEAGQQNAYVTDLQDRPIGVVTRDSIVSAMITPLGKDAISMEVRAKGCPTEGGRVLQITA